ncbi:hypothetical protein B0H10DRAFT_1955714 [Mycena sp. CBHHK59/15]|nr:hypothetical protein B0H10DRAFT_1955714 [Mycena sp. CBHHK59/15]
MLNIQLDANATADTIDMSSSSLGPVRQKVALEDWGFLAIGKLKGSGTEMIMGGNPELYVAWIPKAKKATVLTQYLHFTVKLKVGCTPSQLAVWGLYTGLAIFRDVQWVSWAGLPYGHSLQGHNIVEGQKLCEELQIATPGIGVLLPPQR